MEVWQERSFFYVENGDQRQGPVPLSRLSELYAAQQIDGDSLVWSDRGMDSWLKLKDTAFFPFVTPGQSGAALAALAPLVTSSPSCDGSVPSSPTRLLAGQTGGHQDANRVQLQSVDLGEPSPPKPSDLRAMRSMGGSSMYSGIKGFLAGWLPSRKPPNHLVNRGILHADPSSSSKGSASVGIFGGDLQAILRREDTEDGVPKIVRVLMAKLRANGEEGLRSEGIFRVPGDSTEMRELRESINQGADVEAQIDKCDNLHSVAGLLKMFFRELEQPILTFDLYDDFIRVSTVMGSPSPGTDVSELQSLLQRLPGGQAVLLRHLMLFLAQVASYTSESKMNVGNTAAVFAPNLLRPRVESIEQLADTSHVVNLIAFMISEPHRIFSAFGNERAPASSRVQSNDCLAANDSHASKLQAGPRLTQVASPGATPATADGSKPWYYLNDNLEQQGPIKWEELQQLFSASRLNGSSYVFTEGMTDWTPASNLNITGAEPKPATLDVGS
ncbi:hypothetical protein AB1Y20_014206 [Prymnesium parvum]|uniref:Rho-GAP domain-containing protein n=1 Tax=Prymnesium parvum TaxID=97485 RepID=A0AB34IFJ1_PRYPA|mmetsp:Transcript_39653/g.98215  ORF Transcript_39653/g.98215 Transcript_39653/m.98215 type:complete len:501 (+) Transcript_39653:31-1533(+)